MDLSTSSAQDFIARVWQAGELYERKGLPWRFVDDPFAVYVSEVMLQQTQVARVMKHWDAFMARYPSVDALAAADTASVLQSWQGLGYNRRALALQRAAQECSASYAGRLPEDYDELLRLPGVGPATAAGIMAFAYNRPSVYLETNVRAVFISKFFSDSAEQVSDREIRPLVLATCSQERPREWYYALLDWGAYMKQNQPNPTRKSSQYVRQSAFEGSRRQKRAFLLKIVLTDGPLDLAQAKAALDDAEMRAGRPVVSSQTVESIVGDLVAEGFFTRAGDMLVP